MITCPPHRQLPAPEVLLVLLRTQTQEQVAAQHGVTKHAVRNAVARYRQITGTAPGRTRFEALPWRIPVRYQDSGVWRYLRWNERRNLGQGLPDERAEDQLDRWRAEMHGYVVGFDEDLAPDPDDAVILTSYRGRGGFFVWPRHVNDPVSADPDKPTFITYRNMYGRARTYDEIRPPVAAKPRNLKARRTGLRGM